MKDKLAEHWKYLSKKRGDWIDSEYWKQSKTVAWVGWHLVENDRIRISFTTSKGAYQYSTFYNDDFFTKDNVLSLWLDDMDSGHYDYRAQGTGEDLWNLIHSPLQDALIFFKLGKL